MSVYVRYYESTLRELQALGIIEFPNPGEKVRALFTYMEGVMADARIHNSTDSVERLPRLAFELLGLEPLQAQKSQKAPKSPKSHAA